MNAERGTMHDRRGRDRQRRRFSVQRSAFSVQHSAFSIPRAFTLVEMLVVAAIIGIILAIGVASMRALTGGVQTGAAVTALKSLFASARAEAAARGHLVGVRFQQDDNGNTYGVIIYPANVVPADEPGPPAYLVFQAAPNREPIRLPQGVELAAGKMVGNDVELVGDRLRDNTTFSVLFSPNGQVTVRLIRVIQRSNTDSVFYDPFDTTRPGVATRLLIQDTRNTRPYMPEYTQNSLYIYDQVARREAGAAPWTNYLNSRQNEARYSINPYTGQLQQ